jgi:hypothetical protein
MLEPTVFHEDVFYENFRPFRHPSSHFDIWGGYGLETFGEDLQIVKSYSGNFVWTVVDGSDGPDQWITPGFQFVNRICYLLTEVPHEWAPVEFRTEHRPRPLTHLGLARRMSTLRQLMLMNKALCSSAND